MRHGRPCADTRRAVQQLQNGSEAMQRPTLHQHVDGSAHYTYCHGEDDRRPYRFEWQRPRQRVARPRRTRSGWVLLLSGFGVAAAMFWTTMLVSPPTSEATASLTASAQCSA